MVKLQSEMKLLVLTLLSQISLSSTNQFVDTQRNQFTVGVRLTNSDRQQTTTIAPNYPSQQVDKVTHAQTLGYKIRLFGRLGQVSNMN
jgi:hypothetical protein